MTGGYQNGNHLQWATSIPPPDDPKRTNVTPLLFAEQLTPLTQPTILDRCRYVPLHLAIRVSPCWWCWQRRSRTRLSSGALQKPLHYKKHVIATTTVRLLPTGSGRQCRHREKRVEACEAGTPNVRFVALEPSIRISGPRSASRVRLSINALFCSCLAQFLMQQ